jgi:NMD protein affecting ribosome stability and mRNA decay
MYLPRWSPRGLLTCRGCGAVYYRRRWTLTPPDEIRDKAEFGNGVRSTLCPACRKISDHYPFGELHIVGAGREDARELFRLLRNEEDRAREKNPLERIMRIEANHSGWRIETTTEKLAQRLGRSLRKARGGRVNYQWSHNNKFVRVFWQKEEIDKAMRKGE